AGRRAPRVRRAAAGAGARPPTARRLGPPAPGRWPAALVVAPPPARLLQPTRSVRAPHAHTAHAPAPPLDERPAQGRPPVRTGTPGGDRQVAERKVGAGPDDGPGGEAGEEAGRGGLPRQCQVAGERERGTAGRAEERAGRIAAGLPPALVLLHGREARGQDRRE